MRHLYVVLDGPPSAEGPRFVEVEDEQRLQRGANAGLSWGALEDGNWRIGPFGPALFQDDGEVDLLRTLLREYLRSAPASSEARAVLKRLEAWH